MKVDREEFINAAKFLTPAIFDMEEQNAMKYVHARVDEGKMILTATNGHIGKRRILVEPEVPETIDRYQKKQNGEIDDELEEVSFMIDKATFEAFTILCKKHKAALSEKVKKSPEMRIIHISRSTLESGANVDTYRQPDGLQFPDVSMFFQAKKKAASEIQINPGLFKDALTGFENSKPVEVSLCEKDGIVHFQQDNLTYEAYLILPKS